MLAGEQLVAGGELAVFAVDLLPLVAVVVLAWRWMPESRNQSRERIDLVGLLLLVCALSAMTTALLELHKVLSRRGLTKDFWR